MILILLLCLNLGSLNLCVADYHCVRDTSGDRIEIVLSQQFYDDDRTVSGAMLSKFYNIFRDKCEDYYDIKVEFVHETKPLEEYDKANERNIIHFGRPYKYNETLPRNMVYAGDITHFTNCTRNNESKHEIDCKRSIKLVSKSVLNINNKDLYDFVQKMQIVDGKLMSRESCLYLPRTIDLDTVVLCLNDEYKGSVNVNIKPLKLIITNSCYDTSIVQIIGNKTDHYLAVLAPRPLPFDTESLIPIVFYKTPFMLSDTKSVFPNSMNLTPWRLLKYGFLNFIKTIGWRRVVIVTDDSEYSIEFENELTALLNKELIVHTVVRCEAAKCDMKTITLALRELSPRIVIGNVEEENAKILIQLSSPKITWIMRDLVGHDRNSFIPFQRPEAIFSINLKATQDKNRECNLNDNILDGLAAISWAHNNIANAAYKDSKVNFRRQFFEKIHKFLSTRRIKFKAFVYQLSNYGQTKVVSSMYVTEVGAKLLSFQDPYKSRMKPADGPACWVHSYEYSRPCHDEMIIFLMLIIIVFITLSLTIFCYFDKKSPFHDIRYQHFY